MARLVATGRSNRQAAAELYVSVKTIEFHLGHIFDKLGIRSCLPSLRTSSWSGVPVTDGVVVACVALCDERVLVDGATVAMSA